MLLEFLIVDFSFGLAARSLATPRLRPPLTATATTTTKTLALL
jgi:hypothetical protein